MDAIATDQDQIFHDLEQRYLSLKQSYDNVICERDAFSSKFRHI